MKTILSILIIILASSTQAAPFFLGDWIQKCTVIAEGDVVKNLVLIDSKIMDEVVIAYEEENCQSPYLIFKRQYQMHFNKFSEQEMNVDVDMSVLEVSYTALTDEVTYALNMMAFCGDTNWVTYQEKFVAGKTCQDYKAPAVGTIVRHQFLTKTKSELFFNSDPTPYFKIMP